MAEAVLRARLHATPAAGLARDERTQRVLAERGYPPVPSPFAQMLHERMLHWADLVLVIATPCCGVFHPQPARYGGSAIGWVATFPIRTERTCNRCGTPCA